MTVQVKVPGKLYLAGEYAVVEAGYPAVIAAVDQYLTVTVSPAQTGSVWSSQQEDLTVLWERKDNLITPQHSHPYQLVFSAMQLAEDYLRALGTVPQDTYAVTIHSDLDDGSSGTKYGLGSSGAVTVAVIRAVLSYYHQTWAPLLVYKLAVLAQLSLKMTGSFGDVAASSFGGLIAYYSVDRSWLSGKIAEQPLLEVLEADWQGLAIQSLQLPQSLELLVGWTGKAASTDKLVQEATDKKSQSDKERLHRDFLVASRTCVESMISGCQTGAATVVEQAIQINRDLLQNFASGMGMVIETAKLTQLCQLALDQGAVAKSSGAGGGDCGICLVRSQEQKQAIQVAWREVGILPLPLTIAYL
ncbi:TPA: phosphomevalonate kinase [Streptococcus suis]